MEKLIVKNFGAIKDIEIELKDLTIFIGKSGTGKSTLAKLIAVFRDIDFWNEVKSFEDFLAYFQMGKFLTINSFIDYQSDYLGISYNNGKLSQIRFTPKSLKSVEDIDASIGEFSFEEIIKQSYIIPAERQLTTALNDSYAGIDRKTNLKDFLPESLLDFVGEHNRIGKILSGHNISLFDIQYERGENGEDYVILPNKVKLFLREAASGMQTSVPALLILEYYSQNNKIKKSFTFEEPELNLFPTAQKALVEFMAEKVLNRGHQLVICTHSDHILYSILIECKKYDDSNGEIGIFNETTSIYYLRNEEDVPFITEVKIEQGGKIRKFPDNFFDQHKKYIRELL